MIEYLCDKKISGNVVLLLFIVTNIIYMTMLLYSLPRVASFAPELPLFDMSPTGYSYAKAVELLDALGEQGRGVCRVPRPPLHQSQLLPSATTSVTLFPCLPSPYRLRHRPTSR